MIAERLQRHGLSLRGAFNFNEDEEAPPAASGRPAKAVVLVGNVGAAFWPHFEAWRAEQHRESANPLDTWSRLVIVDIAGQVGARPIMPNDRPFPPFQQWAMRAEGLRQSPLGMLIHPQYGLWHAYRGALLFDRELALDEPFPSSHPCDSCADKPCLKACPVDAYTPAGFSYARCLEHVRGEGWAVCGGGCLDRNACPVGSEHRYPDTVQRFFMEAFAR